MKLLELRKAKKITQTELAKQLGIHQVTYNGYEQEKREPSIDVLCKIADFYNVSLDYLIGRYRDDEIGYLTDDDRQIIKIIQQLNQECKLLLKGYAIALYENQIQNGEKHGSNTNNK